MMSNQYFQFKKFKIIQEKSSAKVGVDSVLFGACITFKSPHRILDIGTGTGLLAFMAAQRTGAFITGVEIDGDSFEECQSNILLNKSESRINVIHDSFQHFHSSCTLTFDHIISNPPWFNNSFHSPDSKRNLARQNASLPIDILIKGASKLLSSSGILSIIIPFDMTDNTISIAEKYKLFCFNKLLIKPHQNKDYNRSILEFSGFLNSCKTAEICIRDSFTGNYSSDYKSMTKDFYL